MLPQIWVGGIVAARSRRGRYRRHLGLAQVMMLFLPRILVQNDTTVALDLKRASEDGQGIETSPYLGRDADRSRAEVEPELFRSMA